MYGTCGRIDNKPDFDFDLTFECHLNVRVCVEEFFDIHCPHCSEVRVG